MATDLLELALSDPDEAWARADAVVGASQDPRELSVAYQARGIVRRDSGHAEDAVLELRVALRYAEKVDAERLADVRATYGVALYLAGRTAAGIRALDQAVAAAEGYVLRSTALMRRAWVLTSVGRHEAALVDMESAIDGMRGRGMPAWEARALVTFGHIQTCLGLVHDAEQSLLEAARIFTDQGLLDEAAHALGNLGTAAVAGGDLPRALQIFDELDPEDIPNSRLRQGLVESHCEALLAAGLTAEATEMSERFLSDITLAVGAQGDLNLALANVRLAERDHRGALSAAVRARVAFQHQQREWFELRARLVEARARYELGDTHGLASAARAVAQRLDEEHAMEAPTALVLAGHLSRGPIRLKLWSAAAGYRDRPNALVRASAWLGQALASEAHDSRAGVMSACRRGLDALDEHRRTLGSSELRALATLHGRELALLGLRHAKREARTLLRWSERWRATALAEPPVIPSGVVSRDLAALRDNRRRLAQARSDNEPTEQLELERVRLEKAVRSEHHRQVGRQDAVRSQFNIELLIADVGLGCFVELVDVDGTLHVIVVHDGKVRRRVAGSTEDALQLAANARSAVRRAAHGRPYQPGDLGERLQEVLLGPAADLLPDGPVVISPTGRLHAVPWSMLPTLSDRAFSIVPSAVQWQRARAVAKPRRKKVLLLAAPGLGTGGSEVPKLARRHEGATLLRGRKATVEAALAGLDGASLAHVAAHGRFRQDSPLFSSLEMADGSLSVYELERLRRAPYRLVLSACESGVLAPVGADELLGLASALFSMGTAGLVCSIAEVNDDATAALMVDLHDHLLAHPKEGLAGALLAARRAAQGDPTREATAAAFLALGV